MTGLGRERLSPWYDADYVFVCVSVCFCVFSRVGASCVGRPICVCAVWAPLRRVNFRGWDLVHPQHTGLVNYLVLLTTQTVCQVDEHPSKRLHKPLHN
jgi:hypothetical protein